MCRKKTCAREDRMLVSVVPAAAIAKYPGQLANTGVYVAEIAVVIKVSPITLTFELSLTQAINFAFKFLLFTPLM